MTLPLPGNPVADDDIQAKFDTISLAWPNRSVGVFFAYRAAAATINDVGVIPFDTELYDTSNWFVTGAAAAFTPKVAGYYRFSLMLTGPAGVAGSFMIPILRKNTAFFAFGWSSTPGGGGTSMRAGLTVNAVANGTTDVFDVAWTHNFGAGLGVMSVGQQNVYFCGELIAP